MASGLYGISAYQQANSTWIKNEIKAKKTDDVPRASRTGRTYGTEEKAEASESQKVWDQKAWTPVDKGSPLVPRATEYGTAIGDVQLSEKGKEYYEKLKGKYHNADFVLVSKDMKAQVQKNAASYGNASRMVVLIDEEKIERMAEDPSYRKKYEGIIAMSQEKLTAAKNSLASSGASVKNFGMSVDENGNESFFATVEKAGEAQKERMEKAAAKKKEQKVRAKKQAEKAERRERLEKSAERKRMQREEAEERLRENGHRDHPEQAEDRIRKNERGNHPGQFEDRIRKTEHGEHPEQAAHLSREEMIRGRERIRKAVQERYGDSEKEAEYLTFEADSLDRLCADVQTYSYQYRLGEIRTESEKVLGQHFDFKG